MFFGFYLLLSTGLFVGIAVRAYFEYGNFFDACQNLLNDKLYMNFTLNFAIAISIFIVNSFLNHYIGKFKSPELHQVFEKLHQFFGQLFFILLSIRTHVGMKELILVPIPLFLRYVEMYINEKITLLSLSAIPPTAKQHQNIAAGQIIVLFAFVYATLQYTIKFQETNLDFVLMLVTQLFHGFCHVLQDIISHIIFLVDRRYNGNSQSSFRANLITQLIIQSLVFIVDVNFFIYMSFSSVYTFFNLKNLFDVVMKMIDKIKRFVKYQCSQKMLKEKLPDATAEDLKIESACIICRNEMEPGKAKKLPCGHCFHLDCLERWIGQQFKCPTCQCDLTKILNPDESSEKNANDTENNAEENVAVQPQDQNNVTHDESYHDFNDFNNNTTEDINNDNENNSNEPLDPTKEREYTRKQIDILLQKLKVFEDELLKIRDNIDKAEGQ